MPRNGVRDAALPSARPRRFFEQFSGGSTARVGVMVSIRGHGPATVFGPTGRPPDTGGRPLGGPVGVSDRHVRADRRVDPSLCSCRFELTGSGIDTVSTARSLAHATNAIQCETGEGVESEPASPRVRGHSGVGVVVAVESGFEPPRRPGPRLRGRPRGGARGPAAVFR